MSKMELVYEYAFNLIQQARCQTGVKIMGYGEHHLWAYDEDLGRTREFTAEELERARGRGCKDEYQPESERPCEPGGNYGLCKTHPTCEMIQKRLEYYKNALQYIADLESPNVESIQHFIHSMFGITSRESKS